jgi:hypothetical protein
MRSLQEGEGVESSILAATSRESARGRWIDRVAKKRGIMYERVYGVP